MQYVDDNKIAVCLHSLYKKYLEKLSSKFLLLLLYKIFYNIKNWKWLFLIICIFQNKHQLHFLKSHTHTHTLSFFLSILCLYSFCCKWRFVVFSFFLWELFCFYILSVTNNTMIFFFFLLNRRGGVKNIFIFLVKPYLW